MKSLLLNRIVTSLSVTALSVGVLTGCSDNSKTNYSVSDASNFTRELNNDVGESLQFTQSDYEQARRGLIAKPINSGLLGKTEPLSGIDRPTTLLPVKLRTL